MALTEQDKQGIYDAALDAAQAKAKERGLMATPGTGTESISHMIAAGAVGAVEYWDKLYFGDFGPDDEEADDDGH